MPSPKLSLLEYMAVKTDMSKAYDRVEWCFLEKLLEKMGFSNTWIQWTMSCVSTVTYTILLNRRTHGFVKPARGIRQGDLMSPFLFILCAEALVNILNKAESEGRLNGISFTMNGHVVHHLLFADDILLMSKAVDTEASEIIRCLKAYINAIGQVINPNKSSIILGNKVPDENKQAVKRILRIDQEGREGKYLGLREWFSGSKRKLLNFIQEKLQSRLNGWFAKILSQGSKEILLKSIGLALPIYTMTCFKLPKDMCKKLVSAMTEFWWSSGNNQKKIPWVAWKKLCRKKDEGGLGFHDIGLFNQALLCKQGESLTNLNHSFLEFSEAGISIMVTFYQVELALDPPTRGEVYALGKNSWKKVN